MPTPLLACGSSFGIGGLLFALFVKPLLIAVGFAAALWVLAHLLVHFARARAHPKFPAGHCLSCGYDLRATPHRCPECGRAYARAPGLPARLPVLSIRRPDPRKAEPLPVESV